MFDRAKHHKVLALLIARLKESGIEEQLPEVAKQRLAVEYSRVLMQSERATRTLQMLGELAKELDSPFFVIKGSLLAQEVYGAAKLRVFNDVDIVVPRDRVDDFDRALRARGYFFWVYPPFHQDLPRWFLREAPDGELRGSKDEGRRLMARFHRHYAYVLKEGDPRLPVEVHWNIFVPGRYSATDTDVWQRIRRLHLGGCSVEALDQEATLLHAAVHALEGGPSQHRLLHLADVVWILHRWGPGMDPETLRDLAGQWKVEAELTAALEGARSVFPFPLPEVVDQLWPYRSRWARRCLALAGLGPGIVEMTESPSQYVRLLSATWGDTLWALSRGQPPADAWVRVRQLIAKHVLRKPEIQVAQRESNAAP